MRASKKSTLKSGKRHYLGSGICFKLQMSLSVTLLMMLIVCLLIQLSILAGSCCGWRKLWKRIRSSAVAPINHDQQIELADASAANSSRNNNSVQSEEFVIITNCFITYTALLIAFFVNCILFLTFGLETTQSVRNMISLFLYAAIPVFRIYKNEKIQNYIIVLLSQFSLSHWFCV